MTVLIVCSFGVQPQLAYKRLRECYLGGAVLDTSPFVLHCGHAFAPCKFARLLARDRLNIVYLFPHRGSKDYPSCPGTIIVMREQFVLSYI